MNVNVATANRGSATASVTASSTDPLTFSCADVGANTVMLTATDNNQNSATDDLPVVTVGTFT